MFVYGYTFWPFSDEVDLFKTNDLNFGPIITNYMEYNNTVINLVQ